MGAWEALAPTQCLAEQLTLSQPGGQIMLTTVLQAPPPKFSDLATALNSTHYLKGLYVDKGNKKQKFTEKY